MCVLALLEALFSAHVVVVIFTLLSSSMLHILCPGKRRLPSKITHLLSRATFKEVSGLGSTSRKLSSGGVKNAIEYRDVFIFDSSWPLEKRTSSFTSAPKYYAKNSKQNLKHPKGEHVISKYAPYSFENTSFHFIHVVLLVACPSIAFFQNKHFLAITKRNNIP